MQVVSAISTYTPELNKQQQKIIIEHLKTLPRLKIEVKEAVTRVHIQKPNNRKTTNLSLTLQISKQNVETSNRVHIQKHPLIRRYCWYIFVCDENNCLCAVKRVYVMDSVLVRFKIDVTSWNGGTLWVYGLSDSYCGVDWVKGVQVAQ